MNSIHSLLRRRLALIALLALAAAACVPIRQEASWPTITILGDENSITMAYNDRVVMVDSADGTALKLRNADGEVRVDDDGAPRIWEFTGPNPGPNQFYAAPVVANEDTMLIAAYNERIYEVDVPTARAREPEGEELPGRALANPLLDDDLIYLGIERDLVALDATNFDERWRIETDQGVWSTPMLIDNILYFTSLDHFLYAVDAETGEEFWRLDLEGAAPASPILHEGRLYVGSFARRILEISLDGEILSEYETNDWVWGAPTVVDGVLYAADASGMVYAINLTEDGLRERWSGQASENAIRATPVVHGEYVIVGSRDQKVYWLDRADGSIFFSREVAGEVVSDLLLIEADEAQGIDESMVVVGTLASEEFLVAFTVQNGERIWSYGR